MKKGAIILFAIIALSITGCGSEKTLTCTKETTQNNLTSKNEITVFYKKDKILKISQQSIVEIEEQLIDQTMEFNQEFLDNFKDINGFEINFSKEGKNTIKSTVVIDYTKIDENQLKDKFGDDFDASQLINIKDKNIEDYKKEELEGFTCK